MARLGFVRQGRALKLPSTERLLVPFAQMLFWAALAAVFLYGFGFISVRGAVLVMFMETLSYVFWGSFHVLVVSSNMNIRTNR